MRFHPPRLMRGFLCPHKIPILACMLPPGSWILGVRRAVSVVPDETTNLFWV